MPHLLKRGSLQQVLPEKKKNLTFFLKGDFDGRVALWNLDRLDLPIWTTRKHENIINSIDGIGGILGGGAPEIVTGSRDGKKKKILLFTNSIKIK